MAPFVKELDVDRTHEEAMSNLIGRLNDVGNSLAVLRSRTERLSRCCEASDADSVGVLLAAGGRTIAIRKREGIADIGRGRATTAQQINQFDS